MVSICILCKNSAATIRSTLDSTRSFEEVILLDTGSTDATLCIASEYPNVVVHKSDFIGFGPLRNKAALLARSEWIFALDSDEVLSSELLREIASLSLDPKVAYSFPRRNFYRGKHIKGCGWHPDRVLRLYHRSHAHYSNDLVHESLVAAHEKKILSPLLHTPYRSTADFLAKMQHYSTLFSEQHGKTGRSSLLKALRHSGFAFFRSFFLKRGFLDGAEGFIISLYNANTTFYKYLKLSEKSLEDRS